ncbi:hypothetical protein LAZ67_13001721 [Cordylochernes scorpioides]|uniref:Uncharacterized protein n=1 Tax=Cordylochernes scorpioides TaxID=51811 RepID=A0ABY6L7K3_9ARAC|nr:hypothetical protein LAZ67_13001721 [Cordylochernes scorpioides]
MEEIYQGVWDCHIMADYCWNLSRDLLEYTYKRGKKVDIHEGLTECIEVKISEGYEVVLAGDLNTLTGTQGYLHNPLMLPTSLNASRNSKDEVISPNAVQFINFLEDNLLVIINGRTKSDENGEYTYISERGCSVVDYCIVSHPLLEHRIDYSTSIFGSYANCIKMDSNLDGMKLESSPPIHVEYDRFRDRNDFCKSFQS